MPLSKTRNRTDEMDQTPKIKNKIIKATAVQYKRDVPYRITTPMPGHNKVASSYPAHISIETDFIMLVFPAHSSDPGHLSKKLNVTHKIIIALSHLNLSRTASSSLPKEGTRGNALQS